MHLKDFEKTIDEFQKQESERIDKMCDELKQQDDGKMEKVHLKSHTPNKIRMKRSISP